MASAASNSTGTSRLAAEFANPGSPGPCPDREPSLCASAHTAGGTPDPSQYGTWGRFRGTVRARTHHAGSRTRRRSWPFGNHRLDRLRLWHEAAGHGRPCATGRGPGGGSGAELAPSGTSRAPPGSKVGKESTTQTSILSRTFDSPSAGRTARKRRLRAMAPRAAEAPGGSASGGRGGDQGLCGFPTA